MARDVIIFMQATPSNGPGNGFAPIKGGRLERYEVYLLRPLTPPPLISKQPFVQDNLEISRYMLHAKNTPPVHKNLIGILKMIGKFSNWFEKCEEKSTN
jgi:hypothetical protein